MRIAIVEDQQYWASRLVETLHTWAEANREIVVDIYTTGSALLRADAMYNIVFMDIELAEGESGLDVASALRESGYRDAIVFTTSHQYIEYIQHGFDVGALQYLVKPVRQEEIDHCMHRYWGEAFFSYTYNGGHYSVPYENILYFESFGHYITVHVLKEAAAEERFRMSVVELVRALPDTFVQMHRSFVVNIGHVVKIKGKDVHLRDGTVLQMGSKYIHDVIQAFELK